MAGEVGVGLVQAAKMTEEIMTVVIRVIVFMRLCYPRLSDFSNM